jgi:hypothetical protein
MRAVLLLAAAGLALAACNQKPAAPASGSDTVNLPAAATPAPPQTPSGPAAPTPGFTHDKGADLFGYYLPAKELKVGNWRLTMLSIGGEDDFARWEAGQQRIATYAPVMLEFEDVTSPTVTNEMGQTVHKVTTRVLPTSYAVSGGKLAFAGQDAKLGPVGFAGVIDLAALKAAKAQGPNGGPATILKGDLKVGSTEFKGFEFTWFGGD